MSRSARRTLEFPERRLAWLLMTPALSLLAKPSRIAWPLPSKVVSYLPTAPASIVDGAGWRADVVPAGRLNVVYDLVPADDAWLVSTYISVEMSAHKGSASKISDAMVKLETWLTGELARVARQQRPAEEPGLPKKGAVAAANRGSGVVSAE